ncbi:MAG: short-chain dehydrogenase/reductase [Flavobacteriales bacterium]|nr:short-chain dehydrogenase/reductase [Flavobacteriales bacterium]|tara:strand:- start:990 stop:1811 length:822 start_codon:yes stop_codon:yes gene_type:complete
MKNVILVTGASSGIGKATAEQLIADGHIVYGAARRIDKMKDLELKGGHAIQMDVTNEAEVKACVDQIIKEQGRIDVLVNNAGYAVYGPVEQVSLDDARRQFEVNIFGLAAITKEVLPHMREKRSGKIINVSSMGGKIYTPFGAWYHGTKHALEGWSDCLRLELKPFGIDVVIIEPGIIKTEFMDVMYDPMVESAKNSPYSEMATKIASSSKEMYEKPGQSSPPTVIAEVISKAVKSQKPKIRYVAGKLAKPLMFMRKWFGDRIFDKGVMSQLK